MPLPCLSPQNCITSFDELIEARCLTTNAKRTCPNIIVRGERTMAWTEFLGGTAERGLRAAGYLPFPIPAPGETWQEALEKRIYADSKFITMGELLWVEESVRSGIDLLPLDDAKSKKLLETMGEFDIATRAEVRKYMGIPCHRDPREFGVVMVPFSLDNSHWYLVELNRSADSVFLYDPLGTKSGDHQIRALASLERYYKRGGYRWFTNICAMPGDPPVQSDAWSCGYHVVEVGRRRSAGQLVAGKVDVRCIVRAVFSNTLAYNTIPFQGTASFRKQGAT